MLQEESGGVQRYRAAGRPPQQAGAIDCTCCAVRNHGAVAPRSDVSKQALLVDLVACGLHLTVFVQHSHLLPMHVQQRSAAAEDEQKLMAMEL